MAEDNRVQLLAAGFGYEDKESATVCSYCCSTRDGTLPAILRTFSLKLGVGRRGNG